jgi:hypothetical protein
LHRWTGVALAIGLYGKMKRKYGYHKMNHMTKIEKTKIFPLRWIGNFLGGYAGNHLVKAIDLDESLDSNLGFRYKYHAKCWKYLNKPYTWWGTYYEIDIKRMMDDNRK